MKSNVQSKKDVWRQGHRVTKEDFARYMRVASGGKEVSSFLNYIFLKYV
jgi:hypothetical protein